MIDPPHIGTLREKPLHASLKNWYSEPGDRVEMRVGRYVIDIVRGDLLIEVQTRSFSSMKSKVKTLLDLGHRIRIVHPIAVNRWIVKVDTNGEVCKGRLSPKHGVASDLFGELVSFPELVLESDLEIEVLLTSEEELRRHTPGRSWRRQGWSVEERRLIDVLDTVLIRNGADLAGLLPKGLPDPFTTTDLAAALGRPLRAAQQMAYCLRHASVIRAVGKLGNANQFSLL